MTRRILLTLADDTTDTGCGSCDYASCLPYADPMIYVCTRPEFAVRVDRGYETAIRVRGERIAACLAAEQRAERCVEIDPALARQAIADGGEGAAYVGAWDTVASALREHGKGEVMDLDEIKARLAALPDGFVLGVDGSYFDTRRLVANMWGEAEEDGDAGPCDPNDPALLAFRDSAIPTIAALVAEVERLRASVDCGRVAHDVLACGQCVGCLRGRLDHQIDRVVEAMKRAEEIETGLAFHPAAAWHDDIGDVLWWRLPIAEPPYCGSPLGSDWPEEASYTHWSRLPTNGEIERAEIAAGVSRG